MDGYYYHLLGLIDQWILGQCKMETEEFKMKLMHSFKEFKLCAFSCCFILVHQTEDLAFNPTKIIMKKPLLGVVLFKILSKFEIKFSNSKSWLGDLYMTPIWPLLFCVMTSQTNAFIEVSWVNNTNSQCFFIDNRWSALIKL